MDNFNKWNEVKKRIDKEEKFPNFREREIWFISVGKNIGYESFGKGEEFLRPVLILKKFGKYTFLGIPLTSKQKIGKYYYPITFKNRENRLLFNQIRVFDIRRAKYRLAKIGNLQFNKIIEKFVEITSIKEERLLANKYARIIPQTSKNVKSILFDLDMPKWVLFFYPIIKELKKRGHNVIITSRGGKDYTELNKVIELYNLDYISIGEYGGASLEGKLKSSLYRIEKLIEIVKNVDVVVSGSVVDINRVAFGLGIPIYNFYDIPLSDYKTDFKKALPQARLTIPLSTKMFKPFVVPDEVILRFGLEKEQILEYNFIDPLIWLKDFNFDKNYVENFYKKYKINRNKFTIVIREEEYKSSYVNKKYPFLYESLPKIYKKFDANIIIIPRYESDYLKKEFPFAYVIDEKIVIQHLLKDVDLFIGGGGTINSESCFLGTPTISTRSFISHYDKWQIDNGLMVWVDNKEDLIKYVEKAKNKKLKVNIEVLNNMKVDIEALTDEILKG